MSVTYERITGRRMRIVRSKPSARLEASKRWRRVQQSPAGQPIDLGENEPAGGRPPTTDEGPTEPKPDGDAGEVDGQADQQGSGKPPRTSRKTSAGQSGKTKHEEG